MIILEMIPSQSGVRQIPCRKSYLIKKKSAISQNKSVHVYQFNHLKQSKYGQTPPSGGTKSSVLCHVTLWASLQDYTADHTACSGQSKESQYDIHRALEKAFRNTDWTGH